MIVIGELINGTRKAVAAAIEQRDMTYIQELATRQAAAGAAFIDCNAGTPGDRERNDMVWIVKAVQEVVTLPLAIDSPNPQVVVAGLEAYTGHETPMVNSVSLEQDRLDQLLPIVVERQTNVVVLCMDDHGVPSQPGKREEIAKQLIDKCVEAGLPPNHLFVDPVVTTQAPDPTTGSLILQAIAAIREFAPEVHITGG
ncbi:MAG: dihydropteroate synthase, partial [Candidatus Zipacnadales bacterium]